MLPSISSKPWKSTSRGYLLSKGWKLERIHDLRALLEEAARYEPGLAKFRRLCAETTAYYVQERYPFFGVRPDREEVKANFEQAQELVQLVEKLADIDY